MPAGVASRQLTGTRSSRGSPPGLRRSGTRPIVQTCGPNAEGARRPHLSASSRRQQHAVHSYEQTAISDRLDDIKNLVRELFELSADQLHAIDQRVDEPKEASERLGRKDWLMIFYGSLVSTFITAAVPPGVIQAS